VIKVVNRCAICWLINDAWIEIIPPQFYKIIDNKDGTYCGENELSYVTFNKDWNINMNIPKT
jgi:hypothetical protein